MNPLSPRFWWRLASSLVRSPAVTVGDRDAWLVLVPSAVADAARRRRCSPLC
jgi:hypothetical protein